jgi:hypothetical protein
MKRRAGLREDVVDQLQSVSVRDINGGKDWEIDPVE